MIVCIAFWIFSNKLNLKQETLFYYNKIRSVTLDNRNWRLYKQNTVVNYKCYHVYSAVACTKKSFMIVIYDCNYSKIVQPVLQTYKLWS